MQKKLIALAVAGLVSGAAFAQSNVTIYGVVDVGGEYGDSDTTSGAGGKFRVQSGQHSGSRIGFKGEEALGNGVKAIWTLEQGFALDNGKATSHGTPAGDSSGANTSSQFDSAGTSLFQRQAWAGLSTNYGTVTFGRQYTPFFRVKAQADTFGVGTGGTWDNLTGFAVGNTNRLNNTVLYASPTFGGGLSGALAYSSGAENNTNANDGVASPEDGGKTWGALFQYDGKGFASNHKAYLGLAYHDVDTNIATTGAVTSTLVNAKAWMLGANYDFGVAKIHAGYARGKADNAAGDLYEGNTWHVGLAVPFAGAHTVKLGYSHADDTTDGRTGDTATNLWSLGYEYAMSKRTLLYANYSSMNIGDNSKMISNSSGGLSAPGIGSATNTGLTSAVGSDPYAFQFGMRHSF